MKRKPGNLILLIFAICLLCDVLVVRPNDEGDFLISIGLIGALISRAFLNDPQSVMVCLLALILASYALARNHGLVDRQSDNWYPLCLFVAFAYGPWEKIVRWFTA